MEQGKKKVVFNLVVIVFILTLVAAALTSVGLYYVFVLIVMGLLPGIISYIVDKRPGKFASKTVFMFNLSGLTPQIAAAFRSGSPDTTALALLTNPYTWLMPYGFSAFGWGMVFLFPQIALLFYVLKAEYTIGKLQHFQKTLLDEWGEGIQGSSASPRKTDAS
ncbi:MAG: hypothetical protein H6908_01810 [Hyphomicrobiales bacterium]|nr:hypothetical protein [Rickettsiales bacterium]MCP5361369.1 hypothetical protein [Hyphomicrobiales bacterium]